MAESDLARANRQMVAERQQLLAEVAQLKLTIAQRGVDAACSVIDGLDQMLAQAASGDRAAQAMLGRLAKQIERAKSAHLGILTPNGS
jgi:hypothetical protein